MAAFIFSCSNDEISLNGITFCFADVKKHTYTHTHTRVVEVEGTLLYPSLKFTSQIYFHRKQITFCVTQDVNFLSFEMLGVPYSDSEVRCLEEGSRVFL